MKAPRAYTPGSESASPSPTFKAALLPNTPSFISPIKNTYFIRCTPMAPPISKFTNSSALAARRVSSRPQTPPDAQQPVSSRYDCSSCQSYGPSISLTPPLTAMDIVSPSIVAARDYYLNLLYQQGNTDISSGSGTGTPHGSIPEEFRAITQILRVPRRHSIAVGLYPKGLEQMKDLKLQVLEVSRRGSATPASNNEELERDNISSRANGNRERWRQNVFRNENDIPSRSPSFSPSAEHLQLPIEKGQRIHNPLDPRYLGNIPHSYTTNKLREWGDVYLFNATTADAFIRAIAIPVQTQSPSSSSSGPVKAEEAGKTPDPAATKQLVKVKVVPHCRARKPFFMQKSFPIRQPTTSPSYRVSKRPSSPRYHLRHHREESKAEALRNTDIEAATRPAVPIHIEYALYRTPLLAAVLLCEHVKRGDTVEIPLPFPEVWEDVIEWVYTGASGANVSPKLRETVEYLGGRI